MLNILSDIYIYIYPPIHTLFLLKLAEVYIKGIYQTESTTTCVLCELPSMCTISHTQNWVIDHNP